MDNQKLFYKIHKGTVTVEDYIAWSHTLLQTNVSSTSLNIIASLASNHNIFEVEDYFKKSLNELHIVPPVIEPNTRAYLCLLASLILKEEAETEIFKLAQEIFSIVIELQYPEDLIEWYNISEMLDRIQYDAAPLDFNKEYVKLKIQEESRKLAKRQPNTDEI